MRLITTGRLKMFTLNLIESISQLIKISIDRHGIESELLLEKLEQYFKIYLQDRKSVSGQLNYLKPVALKLDECGL